MSLLSLHGSVTYGDNTIAQVVTLYETLGLNEDTIADQLDIAGGGRAVRNMLAGSSQLYNDRQREVRAVGAGDLPQESRNELDEQERMAEYAMLKKMYGDLARNPNTSEAVREKALRWLLDEAKGRNDLAADALALKTSAMKGRTGSEERLAKFNAMIAAGQISITVRGGAAPGAHDVVQLPSSDVPQLAVRPEGAGAEDSKTVNIEAKVV